MKRQLFLIWQDFPLAAKLDVHVITEVPPDAAERFTVECVIEALAGRSPSTYQKNWALRHIWPDAPPLSAVLEGMRSRVSSDHCLYGPYLLINDDDPVTWWLASSPQERKLHIFGT